MLSRRKRSGFTLPEVLVTVAIVAVLAAVVVPAVTQQLSKGDTPATLASINGLRTMITSFVSDVRALPGQVDHLQSAIQTTDYQLNGDGTATGATLYNNGQTGRWKGPYDNSGNITGQIPIGYGWTTTNVLYDSTGYLIVELTKTNADSSDAHELEAALDDATVGSNLTGMIRYEVGTAPALDPANKVRLFLMSSAK